LASLATWFPPNRTIAIQACSELARTATDAKNGHLFTVFDGLSSVRPELLLDGTAEHLRGTHSPLVQQLSDGWHVTLWSVETGRIAQYECAIQHSGAKVSVLQAIADRGYPAS
jgi:hypothetical protein